MTISRVVTLIPVVGIMIVFDPCAARTLPIAREVLLAVMARRYPKGTIVRRTTPVTIVPNILALDRVPVASHKRVPGPWTSRSRHLGPRGGRFPNVYTERHAPEYGAARQQKQCE